MRVARDSSSLHWLAFPVCLLCPLVPGDRNKIQDLVLWLLIWGEAANLRHCPEYLCFVFYRMSMERQRVIDSGMIDRDHMDDEWFRCHVIQPAYDIAFAMQQYTRNNGSLKDHPKRPNYDDLNEYFCTQKTTNMNRGAADHCPRTIRLSSRACLIFLCLCLILFLFFQGIVAGWITTRTTTTRIRRSSGGSR